MIKRVTISSIPILCLSTLTFAQQDKSKRPRPPAQADCKLSSGNTIHVDYSSPPAKGRKI